MSRLISIIVILAIFLTFIVLNINNKSNISFGFKTFEEIPVYISVLFAFVLGMVFALPFTFSLLMRLKRSSKEEELHDSDSGGKKLLGRKKDKDAEVSASSEEEVINKESGPYGID